MWLNWHSICKLPVYMCKPHVNQWFTHVNQQFTHSQRLSLHSRSLESYRVDYMCKCGWIYIASARASAIEVYTCKLALAHGTLAALYDSNDLECKDSLCLCVNHQFTCVNCWFRCVNLNGRCSGRCYVNSTTFTCVISLVWFQWSGM